MVFEILLLVSFSVQHCDFFFPSKVWLLFEFLSFLEQLWIYIQRMDARFDDRKHTVVNAFVNFCVRVICTLSRAD